MPDYAGDYPATYPKLIGLEEVLPERPRAFHVMTKPIGALCNLDCTYCFYLRKEQLYPDERGAAWRMSDEVLEAYIRQYIETQQVPEVNFAWQGGEPTLLGVDFFRRAVELQKRYRRPGMVIHNAFQTNGTLLDDEWGAFLHEHHFLIGLSIDGPRELHDHYRVDKGGKPSFDQVMAGLELLKKHKVEHNLLCVVNRHNSRHPREVYRFFRDELDETYYQFIPAVEFVPGGGVTEWTVRPEDYGDFLCGVFDEWVRHDVGTRYVQIFDVALRAWCGLDPGLCVFSERCGDALAMEHNGDLYSCDHFVVPHNRLGNILSESLSDLVASPLQRKFGR
ncbi:MAG: anaerobic sulfatase maturase, partial [Armatimonadetes bacterium]|nr:anaerobic sulfatase maturase [Armatimonadota bacterium]